MIVKWTNSNNNTTSNYLRDTVREKNGVSGRKDQLFFLSFTGYVHILCVVCVCDVCVCVWTRN